MNTAQSRPVTSQSMLVRRRKMRQRVLALAAMVALSGPVGQAWAADTAGAVTGDVKTATNTGLPRGADLTITSRSGTGLIEYKDSGTTGTRLDLHANDKAILQWDHSGTATGFNIGSGKTLSIINDSNNFTLLNVVSGGAGTTIAGTITTLGANASVAILDPNGITISSGASVNDITNLGLFTQDATGGAATLGASTLNAASANFGMTMGALSNTTKDVTINQNIGLQSGGNLLIRADGAVTINGGSTGSTQAQDVSITANGAVTIGANTEIKSIGTLSVSTANNQNASLRTTGATTLGDINVGTGTATITASGQLTQGSSSKITSGNALVITSSTVGTSEATGLNFATSNVKVDNGSSASTGQAIYINSVDGATVSLDAVKGSSVTLGNPGGGAGTGKFVGKAAGATTDLTATTLTIANASGDISSIKTAVSNLALNGAGNTTLTNTGALIIDSGSTTNTGGATIQLTNDENITVVGTFDSAASKGSTLTLTTTAAGKTVTFADASGGIKLKNLNVVSDNVVINDPTSGHITLDSGGIASIRAVTTTRNINLGTHPGTGLDLSATELLAFGAAGGGSKLIIGASANGSSPSTGTITVTSNVTSKNGLSLYGGALALTGGTITVNDGTTNQDFAATIVNAAGTGGDITTVADGAFASSTADITAAKIDLIAKGSVGAATLADLDITATGVVNVTAGNSAAASAETINLRSIGTGSLALGLLKVQDSVAALTAGDTINLILGDDVTDGNSAAGNLIAQTVNIQGTTTNNTAVATAIGTAAAPIKLSKATTVTLQDANGGTPQDSALATTFEGVHLSTDQSLTLANALYTSTTGGTGVSLLLTGTGTTLNNNGKAIVSGTSSNVI
ncbi:MAG: filamentous hemagglutinin N-terminal domain-containing protein, partial [Magnetococcales bacterium]|nr:filamentous hemagglutinin N-terminal domain-containing protein [Magnetococcales bacterium]